MRYGNPTEVDSLIEDVRLTARIPGIAIAIVANGETIFSRGYGYRDLEQKLPMTEKTVYPIASTTKGINATLLGTLVDEGKVAWDIPVQVYIPYFGLKDSFASTHATLRDLVSMRTGLPRHDWMWIENPISRAELVSRLRYLDTSAGFRERYQYNNLTVIAAGHVAEVLTSQAWEELVLQRILKPLEMTHSGFSPYVTDNFSLSYHENRSRELLVSRRLYGDVSAPSGTVIHSTVQDMARWMICNLKKGSTQSGQLVSSTTLTAIHSPQVVAGLDSSAPGPEATYAMGWFVDAYRGRKRLSHGGYHHDVNSELMLFPDEGLGIVSVTNFGPPRLARYIGQRVFDLLMGISPSQGVAELLTAYEQKIDEIARRDSSLVRVNGTSPSHSLDEYSGIYVHPAYGRLDIGRQAEVLTLQRHNLVLPLEHWHYDAWVVAESELFPIHQPHALDRASRVLFETDADGEIIALRIQLEPMVQPIRFAKGGLHAHRMECSQWN